MYALEAGKHPVLMHYANIWPLKIYLRDWMVPSRRSRRHNPTNAKSCMKQSKVMVRPYCRHQAHIADCRIPG